MPVTRLEVAEMVGSAFDRHDAAVRRDDLVAAAVASGARSEVLAVLARLSEAKFHSIRELWRELGDLPVEPVEAATP